jgi:predicted phosphoribosyltransferase
MGQASELKTPVAKFKDRASAARRLALCLAPYRERRPLVLGIPPGSAAMAGVVARELGGDVDVALVRSLNASKDGAPPLGAVSESGVVFVQEGWDASATGAELKAISEEALAALRRVREEYTPRSVRKSPTERLVILVDDGTATGAMLTAVILSVRESGARTVIVASAVASVEAAEAVRREADVALFLHTLGPLGTVPSQYEDFGETSQRSIRDLLRDASRKPFTRGGG